MNEFSLVLYTNGKSGEKTTREISADEFRKMVEEDPLAVKELVIVHFEDDGTESRFVFPYPFDPENQIVEFKSTTSDNYPLQTWTVTIED